MALEEGHEEAEADDDHDAHMAGIGDPRTKATKTSRSASDAVRGTCRCLWVSMHAKPTCRTCSSATLHREMSRPPQTQWPHNNHTVNMPPSRHAPTHQVPTHARIRASTSARSATRKYGHGRRELPQHGSGTKGGIRQRHGTHLACPTQSRQQPRSRCQGRPAAAR